MYPTKHSQLGWEILWWTALITLAAWLALFLLNSPVHGDQLAAVDSTPAIASTAAQHWAIAVDNYRCGDFSAAEDELDKALAAMPAGGPNELALETWQAMITQARGELSRAVALWHAVELPPQTAVWSDVALGAAHLEQGNVYAASLVLDTAWDADEGNPVVHYFTALLHMEEAELSHDWPDAVGGRTTRWAGYTRPTVVPNTASMYRLAAAMEFENAIDRSDTLNAEAPLLPTIGTSDPTLQPVVSDLLIAVGADNYLANSHHILGHLFLERDNPKAAESHFDDARELGAAVLFGYDELGSWYEENGRHLDAGRAYAKSLQAMPGHGGSGLKIMENLGHAVEQIWHR